MKIRRCARNCEPGADEPIVPLVLPYGQAGKAVQKALIGKPGDLPSRRSSWAGVSLWDRKSVFPRNDRTANFRRRSLSGLRAGHMSVLRGEAPELPENLTGIQVKARSLQRILAIGGLLLGAASTLVNCAPVATHGPGSPQRIVSLDYCADQYVLQFADREDILALSPDAEKPFSYLRGKARGITKVRPRVADILALQPDLVVRSYGGGPGADRFLEQAGIPVVQLGYPQSLSDIREEAARVGGLLGHEQQAQALVEDMDRRLAAIRARNGEPQEVLYMTPGGASAGENTMVDELFRAAGLRNFLKRPGWHDVPLEQLAYEQPDLVAAAFFESDQSHTGSWSSARHPVARTQLRELPVVPLEGSWTSCGGWFVIDAIEALATTKGEKL